MSIKKIEGKNQKEEKIIGFDLNILISDNLLDTKVFLFIDAVKPATSTTKYVLRQFNSF